jgi:hypothetical protein
MRLETEKEATPFPSSADEPSVEPPSMKVAVPVTPEEGLTVAVNVTCCPKAEGFSDDVNAVVVSTGLPSTVCVKDNEMLLA